jgi:hypothetical protein
MTAARGVRRVDREEQEVRAGREAADRLGDSWPDMSWVPEAPSEAWARAAIERLAELIRNQKPIFRASQKGSERGAESLSAQPFQGLLESLQNADDLGAGELRIAVRDQGGRRELAAEIETVEPLEVRFDRVPVLREDGADAELPSSNPYISGMASLSA